MDRVVTARFYRVRQNNDQTPGFEVALKAALDLGPNPSDRERDLGGDQQIVIRLESLRFDQNYYWGEFIRKQTRALPPEAHDAGLSGLPLRSGGGLGHSLAFRYNFRLGILLVQNSQTFSSERVRAYVETVNQLASYEFDAVARADAWARFNSGEPRKLRFKVARPNDLSFADSGTRSIAQGVANVAEAFNGTYITVEVSVGRGHDSLAKSRVREFVDSLLAGIGVGRVDGKSLSVDVKEGDGRAEKIDFLEEHLVVTQELELPDNDPSTNYTIREAFLTMKFGEHIEYLRGLAS